MKFFCNILFVKKINFEMFFRKEFFLFRKFFFINNMFLELFDFDFFFERNNFSEF